MTFARPATWPIWGAVFVAFAAATGDGELDTPGNGENPDLCGKPRVIILA
jgi:hypothetical protein